MSSVRFLLSLKFLFLAPMDQTAYYDLGIVIIPSSNKIQGRIVPQKKGEG
jgi:hypothetical protein